MSNLTCTTPKIAKIAFKRVPSGNRRNHSQTTTPSKNGSLDPQKLTHMADEKQRSNEALISGFGQYVSNYKKYTSTDHDAKQAKIKKAAFVLENFSSFENSQKVSMLLDSARLIFKRVDHGHDSEKAYEDMVNSGHTTCESEIQKLRTCLTSKDITENEFHIACRLLLGYKHSPAKGAVAGGAPAGKKLVIDLTADSDGD